MKKIKKNKRHDARTPRQIAREWTVQAIYHWILTSYDPQEIQQNILNGIVKQNSSPNLDLFKSLFHGTIQNLEAIKTTIQPFSKRDEKEVSPIVKSILYLSTYEILYVTPTPVAVIINEAIEITKIYCSPEAYRYVNGVLQQIAEQYRLDEISS